MTRPLTAFPNDRERDVRAYLKKRLKLFGGELRKLSWFQRNGAPDELVLLPGIDGVCGPEACFVELKAPGKAPKAHQQREIDKLRAYGLKVLVLDTREAVDAALFWRRDHV